MPHPPRLISFALLACFAGALNAQEIRNWTAPPFWSPAEKATTKTGPSIQGAEGVPGLPTSPVPFVGIVPCRIVDTRGNGFTGAYGPPALSGLATARVFNVPSGPCPGIPADAAAFSINIAAILPAEDGFLTAFPTGGTQPNASTLNYLGGEVVANAAVIAAGTDGSISVFVNVTTHVIIDINGYYAGSVVTTLNGLSGDVSLAAGSNVTITPGGQTLTIGASGGLPSGTQNQTLRHDGANWVASSALENDGTDIDISGDIEISGTVDLINGPVHIESGGLRFIHNFGGTNNIFVGSGSGNFTMTGGSNAALGVFAFDENVSGSGNVAVGNFALGKNTSGGSNTALGASSLDDNLGGHNNTAIGSGALTSNQSGNGNTGIGSVAGANSVSGNLNIFIGHQSGSAISTGSRNILIGNAGFNNESGQIRIGEVANITSGTVIVGIHGFSSVGGIPVYVNGGGRLGTSTSSARFKEDIRDLGAVSDGLMNLRPVAFKYKRDHEASGVTHYGLVAEEVAEIYPELVAYDDEGKPFAIRSQLLDPLVLNELQKQRRDLDAQRAEIEELKAQLERLVTRAKD